MKGGCCDKETVIPRGIIEREEFCAITSKGRKCTDAFCCLVFLIFLALWVGCFGVGLHFGEGFKSLIYARDYKVSERERDEQRERETEREEGRDLGRGRGSLRWRRTRVRTGTRSVERSLPCHSLASAHHAGPPVRWRSFPQRDVDVLSAAEGRLAGVRRRAGAGHHRRAVRHHKPNGEP